MKQNNTNITLANVARRAERVDWFICGVIDVLPRPPRLCAIGPCFVTYHDEAGHYHLWNGCRVVVW